MKKPSVLICDDEVGVRESLKLILGDVYELSFAGDGEEAVQYVKSHDPDVAILDVKMPKMNGLDALRQIKQLKPQIKVLMITGYEASTVATQAINLGASDYIAKPFDGQKVKEQIQILLDSKGA